jgi:uncharacterized Fe-S radical SAM superfamily protein PflX
MAGRSARRFTPDSSTAFHAACLVICVACLAFDVAGFLVVRARRHAQPAAPRAVIEGRVAPQQAR